MKKVIFLLLLPLMAEVVVSCCNCIEPVIQHYTNKTISLSHLDNSGQEAIVSASNTVLKSAYGIRLQLIREKLACLQQRPSLFLPSAYAMGCHCPPPQQYLAKDSIASITLFTLADFDNDHPAGADLSGYFKVYKPYSYTPIEDFVKNAPGTLFDERELSTTIDLFLMAVPAVGGDHRFKVQVRLSDGRILEQETSPVKLL